MAKREDLKDSFLLMLGDKGAGKHSLIREIDAKHVLARNKFMAVD